MIIECKRIGNAKLALMIEEFQKTPLSQDEKGEEK
jgi:hypothetical protein